MRERLVRAASRNALLAAGVAAAMIYRTRRPAGPRGLVISIVTISVVVGLTFVVATALQVNSRVDRWSWTTTLGAFFLSLIGVSIAATVAIRVALAFL
jgi:hypothetical protein